MRNLLFLFAIVAGLAATAQIAPRVQVFGAVTDARNGKVVHATVALYAANGHLLALTDVNSEGRYSLFVPAGAALELRVEEDGYAELHRPFGPLAEEPRTIEIDIALVAR